MFKALASLVIVLIGFKASADNNIIRIPGSSTAYPFISALAQVFSLDHGKYTAIVESTGTGNGLKLFCSGTSAAYPELASASRKIKPSEVQLCKENNIENFIEIKYGYDGIILANAQRKQQFKLTRNELFLALAEKVPVGQTLVKNPYQKWSDINNELPDIKIEVYGPASTSGTRDEFDQIIMEDACKALDQYKEDSALCKNIRQDGKYIEIGNNENLIIQKLKKNNRSFGIIGYNFYQKNRPALRAVMIENVMPDSANIRSGQYILSRPLLIYAKPKGKVLDTKIKMFLESLFERRIIGDKGFLVTKGLVPLTDKDFNDIKELIKKY